MTTAVPASTSTVRGIALSVVVATVAAGVVNSVIALVARVSGADAMVITGLQPPVYLAFTLLGTLIGALGWVTIRRYATDPASVIRWLVPTVVLISLVPDLLVGLQLGWGMLGLAFMHPVVAAAAVLAYRRFLKLPGR